MLERVRVELHERSYDIWIGDDVLGRVCEFFEPLEWHHLVVVADAHVAGLYGEPLLEQLEPDGRVDLIQVPAGESSKSVEQANRLWEALRALGADRRSTVVALGGGVIGDLAGFVAATYARGLRFVQLPTTLLAQVDSSVGGKTAVNLPTAKNMVGAFWQPELVLIDVTTLESLPDREFRAGLAEVVKYGVIMDAPFFEFLEEHADSITARDRPTVITVVRRCCQLKAKVVSEDERETTGRRAILNYGHTFAHAFEATAGYGELLHGEAVAIGMMCAARAACELGRVDEDFAHRQQSLLKRLGLPTMLPHPIELNQVLSATLRDKKVEAGTLHWVLPTRLGAVERVSGVDPAVIERAFVGAGCAPRGESEAAPGG